MLIRPAALWIEDPLVATVYFWVLISFPGMPRRKAQWQSPLLRLNKLLADTAAELTWVCKILQDISFPLLRTPSIFRDNKGTLL